MSDEGGHCRHCAPGCDGHDDGERRAHHQTRDSVNYDGRLIPYRSSEWDTGACPACAYAVEIAAYLRKIDAQHTDPIIGYLATNIERGEIEYP